MISPANPHRRLPLSKKHRPIKPPCLWRTQSPTVEVKCYAVLVCREHDRVYDLRPLHQELPGLEMPDEIPVYREAVGQLEKRLRASVKNLRFRVSESAHIFMPSMTLEISWERPARVPARLSPKLRAFLKI